MELKEILSEIKQEQEKSKQKFIVLDDDPTGTQCCNDVYVYFKWGRKQIDELMNDDDHAASFVLTNSRSLLKKDTMALHTSLMKTILAEAKAQHKDFQILSRSDSTLRWNYPCEIDAIADVIRNDGIDPGAEIICPCFIEGGRLTKNNIHYAAEHDCWIPIGKTEFAKDRTFAYHSSNLIEYICEKRKMPIDRDRFVSVSNAALEEQSNTVLDQLMKAEDGQFIIVNAVNEKQIAYFALQYLKACRQGKHFLYRGASSMIRYLMKQPYIPDWRPQKEDMKNGRGGLIVAGSHVEKTTIQLQTAEKAGLFETVVFHQASLLLGEECQQSEIENCTEKIEKALSAGRTVCYMTDRRRIDLPDCDEQMQLKFASQISASFLSVILKIHTVPSFVIGKGGITSCALGEMMMRTDRVLVLGQIEKGITVWRGEEKALFPNVPYIVFPGNVGNGETLMHVIEKMQILSGGF
ncbi:MAG: hypothetical protein LKF83_02745 [Solobacterium sp.]|jgi:uncharacterized protein YgbK (DUF1537 family)|nr:hypothetical protein [Solobacterium sp.]